MEFLEKEPAQGWHASTPCFGILFVATGIGADREFPVANEFIFIDLL